MKGTWSWFHPRTKFIALCLLFLNGRIYSCPTPNLSSTPNSPVSPRNDFTIYLTERVELIKHELILNPYPDKSILQIHSFSLFQNLKEGLPIPGCCSLYLISVEQLIWLKVTYKCDMSGFTPHRTVFSFRCRQSLVISSPLFDRFVPKSSEAQTCVAHHSTLSKCNLHFSAVSSFVTRRKRWIRWESRACPKCTSRKGPRNCHMTFPLPFHWPEFSHMATPSQEEVMCPVKNSLFMEEGRIDFGGHSGVSAVTKKLIFLCVL